MMCLKYAAYTSEMINAHDMNLHRLMSSQEG